MKLKLVTLPQQPSPFRWPKQGEVWRYGNGDLAIASGEEGRPYFAFLGGGTYGAQERPVDKGLLEAFWTFYADGIEQ